jgi:membrane associated rhomboid family serine protease
MTPIDHDELRGGRRIFLVLAGGALGFVMVWFVAGLFGVPTDSSSGISAVLSGVMPIGVISGCVAGAFVAFKIEKRKRKR